VLNKKKIASQKMVLPIKVSIEKVTHLAHTVDIAPSGARIVAHRTPLQPGTIISLQRESKKREFRVEWIKQLSPHELPGNCFQRPLVSLTFTDRL
jgi:hypothetical protein